MSSNRFLSPPFISLVVAALTCFLAGCVQERVSVILTYQPSQTAAAQLGTDDLVRCINRRLRHAGKATALPNGQLEVVLYGKIDEARLKALKLRISSMGQLEFRILADSRYPEDQEIIKEAKLVPSDQCEVSFEDNKVAEWNVHSGKDLDDVNRQSSGVVLRSAGERVEALVLMDAYDVTGAYLASATKRFDERGTPGIHVTFNREGSRRLGLLTSANTPKPGAPDLRRRLGIILDNRIISAPTIFTRVADQAIISGGRMTVDEVESIVIVFHEGSLPYPIQLVQEERIADN